MKIVGDLNKVVGDQSDIKEGLQNVQADIDEMK